MGEGKANILHVDDDEANRYAVTRSLVRAGFAVTEAADGAEALHKVAEKPDLVILDIRLPDIDGFEVCRRIKSDPATSDIPVLHLSASFISSEDKAHGLDSGADAYLVRPVEPVELVATVNALLRARHSEKQLREAEARFRFVIESIKDYAIFTIDLDGRITSWNAGAERVLGYAESEVLGQSADLFFTAEDRAARAAEREMETARAEGRATDIRWHVRKSGQRFFADGVLTAARDEAGNLVAYTKVMRDVTDRKRAEEELRRHNEEREKLLVSERAARAEAERAGRMKDDFLATLSHELRTPLNAILGWSSILRNGGADEEDLKQGLDTIERNARAQTQIIEDLLDMSRIISGKVRLDVQPLDLAAVVQAAIATAKPAADAKSVRLHTVLDSKAGAIAGDPNRLQQVMWNLLSNAIKFTPRGGRIHVLLERVESGIEVSVEDSGEGIEPKFLPHVFDRFRQADASTTRRHGGLGLGLAIVKQLVELHGGTVRVDSAGAGRGAKFSVSVPISPIAREPEPPVEHRQVEDPAVPAVTADLCVHIAGVRVLVVDDEPDSRLLVKRLLEDCEAVVTTAASASEAVQRVQADRPDVLVSDIGMPGEDGYSLIRRVRALGAPRGGDVPALALTAYARAEDRMRSVVAGYQMHVAKPVEPAELITMVASLAGRTGQGPTL